MLNIKAKSKISFDAVNFMRQQREAISKDIATMTFEELRQYFAASKADERVLPSR